jgi:hypothetical protein
MSTEEAYIEGFIKRAAEYGFSFDEALAIFKNAADLPDGVPAVPLSALDSRNSKNPAKPMPRGPAPKINPAHMNDLGKNTPRG